MLPFSRRSPYSAYAPGVDESEALQADVMRFMAILGLCLMVIFALVQSLPMAPVDTAARTALAAELQRLEKAVAENDARRARQEAELSRLQQALSATAEAERLAQQRLERLEEKAREQAERSRAEQQRLERAGQAATARLAALEVQIQQRERTLALREAAERSAPPVAEPRPGPTEVRPAVETAEVVEPAPAATPEREGFRLRFASDTALLRQVARGGVTVYVKAGGKGWMLQRDGRSLVPAALPGSFHEMASGTVPRQFHALLIRAGAAGEGVTWGVTLAEGVQAGIQRRMQGVSGGDLVIQADGEVRLD